MDSKKKPLANKKDATGKPPAAKSNATTKSKSTKKVKKDANAATVKKEGAPKK